MRTKSLNLKKKIAFIASVAMLASTVAYLPADFVKDIGIGNGIVADAKVPAATAIYDEDANTVAAAATNGVDTMNVFVQIDGKYLATATSGADAGKFKLFNTLNAIKSDSNYKAVDVKAAFTEVTGATDDPYHEDDAYIKALNPTGTTANAYKVFKQTNVANKQNVLELPYIASANTVTLEFAAKTGASLSGRSIDSIEIELDENGIGRIGKQNEYVVAYSKESNYDETKDAFKADTAAGIYEIIDMSNFAVSMQNNNFYDNNGDSYAADAIEADLSGVTLYSVNNDKTENTVNAYAPDLGFTFVKNNESYNILDEDDVYSDTYEVKKIGNVYARVITGTLKAAVTPNSSIVINTGAYSTWSVSGTGTNATDKTVKVTMNESGYGVSGLVTMTSGTNKEYYVYVVKNPASGLNNAAEKQMNFKIPGVVDTAVALDSTNTGVNETTPYKVKKSVVTEKVGTTNKYVTKYTIYNNAKTDGFSDLSKEDKTVTISLVADANAACVFDFAETPIAGMTSVPAADDASRTRNDTTVGVLTAGASKQKVNVELTDAGTGLSEVLTFKYGENNADKAYVEFEFTNEYKIKYDKRYADARTDNTKDYDGKVSVVGQKTSNPGKVDKPGFEFRGWKSITDYKKAFSEDSYGTNTDKNVYNYVYSEDNGTEQLEGTEITPNTILRAEYEGYRYNVDLDGNGGYMPESTTTEPNGNANVNLMTYAYFPGSSTKLASKGSCTSLKRVTANTDITTFKNAVAKKIGYDFHGWSTDKNATKAMTTKELAAAFPGEGKTLQLYAVYTAKEDIPASFRMIGFDANGASAMTDGKITTKTINDVWKNADSDTDGKAKFENSADGVASFTVGQKLGTLPTPYAKGYEFEGWYAKTFSNNLANVTATKVTKDTVLDGSILHERTTGDGTAATFTGGNVQEAEVLLYAKFNQKTYNISFDIGDGAWANAKVADEEEGNLPATMAYNGSTETFTYRRADGSVMSAADYTGVANPKVGSDEFVKFKNWTINNGRTTYTSLDKVYEALGKMDSLEDVVIKANYKEEENPTKSSIFLNANEGAFYTYNVADVNTTTKKPSAFLTTNGKDYAAYTIDKTAANYENGEVVNETNKTFISEEAKEAFLAKLSIADFQTTGLPLTDGTAGAKVSSKYTIKGDTIEAVSGNVGVEIARPGYEFTGWYTDKECTKLYTFDAYPEAGTETVLYAGWNPLTTVRYNLKYDLFDEDSSIAATNQVKTYYGTMGSTVDARNIKVSVKSGTGTTQTTTKYVFDETLSNGLDFTTNELKCDYDVTSIAYGKFEQAQPYTYVQGRYIEESAATPVATLGTATNVKANNGTVTFTAAANADHYKVQKTYTTGGTTKTALGGAFTGTSGSYKVPTEGSSYKIAVIAYNADESKSTVSAAVTVNISAAATVGKATNLKVDNGTVTFTAAANADHYKVQKTYTNAQGKEVTAKGSAFTGTKGTFSVPAQGDYKIAVIAYDKNETQAVVSGTVTVKAAAATTMDAVDDSTITVDTATGKVSWSAAKGAKYYKVFKIVKENGKEKTYWGSKVSDTSYTFKNLPTDDFKVYVAAISEDGNTVKYSAKVKVSLLPAATNVKISSDKKTVSWTKVTGDKADKIVKYQVAKFNPDTNTTDYSVKVDASESSITMKNAAKSGIKIFVLAFDADGNSSYSQSITVE